MKVPEPIAIVGMACRFAGGADSLESFWSMLSDGATAVGPLPADRWEWYALRGHENAAVLNETTQLGSFLDDVRGFDADFFDITPREAALMDPQQRIVLELAWEALEHAGIPPHTLAGGDAGVFMGVGADDYGRRMLEDLPSIEAWTGIGGSLCAVANRVSYAFDLRGPSMVVDTACSSSLVSIHLAAQALRAGECPVALAGGVLVIAGPGLSVVLDAAGATSPDGRSKSFDASADGYGRGEGAGVLVLKLLSDARRDGDRVLAVIRGSGVHQDGRTNGIMAPSGTAQAHLMRRTYAAAGIDPATVSYVEAHGTGTSVGDPLEASALADVFGLGRPADQPCLIGSVKPNIGHLEAGAGVAGVIKTVLALRAGVIPPSVGIVTEPNPAIPWDTNGLRVVTEATPWERGETVRRAGVSGYGYGGTIAHVVLEEGDPEPAGTPGVPGRPAVHPISGASKAAVAEFAGRLADRLAADEGLTAADVRHTLGTRRTHLRHRTAVVATSRDELVARLREVADAGADGIVDPVSEDAVRRGLVWVFSGHGSQWTGMGRGLLDTDPAFTEVIDALGPWFAEELGITPRAVIGSDTDQPVDVVQPMIFATQVALAASWNALGVRPSAVIGHSVGEIAAAVTAGMLTLEQGARLVCRRSVLLRRVAGQGAMALVSLSPEEAERRLAGTAVSVAVATTGASSVISGSAADVRAISELWAEEGVVVRRVDSDVAFHSPHMDPLTDELTAAAADLPPARAVLPVYSTALPDPRSDAPRDGAYWAANLRGQVRFAGAVAAAAADGYRLFLEVATHPVVAHSITEALDELGIPQAHVGHTLRRGKPEVELLLGNLAALYAHGADVDWAAADDGGKAVELPSTAWQHRPHWLPEDLTRSFLAQQHDRASHTLLGSRINVHGANPTQVWLTLLEHESRPYPGDHPVRDVEIIPAAVLLNSFLTAAATEDRWSALSDVALRLPVSVTTRRTLQVVLQDGALRLSSRIIDGADESTDKGWVTHTTAVVEPHPGALPTAPPAPVAPERLPGSFVIDRLATLGVAAMGFHWTVTDLHRGDDGLVATVQTDLDDPPATWAPLLDAALSTASVVFPGPPVLRMPAHIQHVVLAERAPAAATVAVTRVAPDTVDVVITDADGNVVGLLDRLRYGVLDSDIGVVTSPRKLVHRAGWQPADVPEGEPLSDVVVVGPGSPLLARVRRALVRTGTPHRVFDEPEALAGLAEPARTVLVVPDRGGDLLEEAATAAAWLLTRTVQALDSAREDRAKVWVLTEGVREAVDRGALAQAPVWGAGRVVGGEHPGLWGGVVDVGDSPADLEALPALLAGSRGEDVVAVRGGAVEVLRLFRVDGSGDHPPVSCRPDGTYLVTGGLGALGVEVAHWLAERGMRRVVLATRQGLPPRSTWDTLTEPGVRARVEAVRSLERLGVTVRVVAVDIADAAAAAAALDNEALGLPPYRGVVHAAGVLDNQPVRALDEESLRTVLRPKIGGALVLDALFPAGSLDFLVLFSSCGQHLNLPGQASYAAGNAFLDALAAHRRAAGDAGATSVAWTSWRGLGMSTSTEVIEMELAARGTADISPAEAFGSWDLIASHGLGHAVVLRVLPAEPGVRRVPVLAELPEELPEGREAVEETAPWAQLSGPELRAALAEQLCADVGEETGLSPAEVDTAKPLIEMGLDSVMTVRIRRRMERRFALALPPTLFWDRPTIAAVCELLAERIAGTEDGEQRAA